MKVINIVTYSLLLLVGIAGIFAPYINAEGTYISIIQIFQNYEVNGVFAVFFVAFSLYFAGIILFYFPRKWIWVPVASNILLVSATVLFACSKTFLKSSASLGTFTLAASPILLTLLSFSSAIYICRYIFDNTKLSIRDIAEIAIFVSFAFVLDLPLFKFKVVANGGSISLIMLPLILLALRKGFSRGFIGAGIVFGLVSCFLDGYGLITYPLDYLLGFGSLAVVGFFRKFIIGKEKITWVNYLLLFGVTLLGMTIRTFASTLSGIIIYELDFVSSLVYQLTYMGPSFIAVTVVLLILLYPLNKITLKHR